MKIRTDYVSNSSSSSFVLVGHVFDTDKLINLLGGDDKLLEKFNESREEKFATLDEAIDDYGIFDIVDTAIEDTKLQCECEASDWGNGCDHIAVGIDPTRTMSENQTYGEFKDQILEEFKKCGLELKRSDIKFITGGSDAGGNSWLYDRG